MKITIIQAEIEEAIRDYIGGQGINVTGKSLTVDLTAGRGSFGFSAEISLVPVDPGVSASPAEAIVKADTPPVAISPAENVKTAKEPADDVSLFGGKTKDVKSA